MKKLIILFLIPLFSWVLKAQVSVYPNGNHSKTSTHYTVTAGAMSSPVYVALAGSCPSGQCGGNANKTVSYTIFSQVGSTTITVTKLGSSATSAIMRPNVLGIGRISTVVSGGNSTVTFTLSSPKTVSVEFSDDTVNYNHKLFIFAKKPPTNIPDTTLNCHVVHDSASFYTALSTDTVLYLRPGTIKFGRFIIPSRFVRIYLSPGTYAEGYFYKPTGATLVINGFGILSATGYPYHNGGSSYSAWYKMIEASTHISIYDITIAEPTGPMINLTNVFTIDRVQEIGLFFNNDGITPGGSGTISNCMITDEDDAIVPFGSNITIKHNIFWETQGAAIQLGWTPHTLSNITITGNTVIHDQNSFSPFNNPDQGFINAQMVSGTTIPAVISNIFSDSTTFDTRVNVVVDIRSYRSGINYGIFQSPWSYVNFTMQHVFLSQGTFDQPQFFTYLYNPCQLPASYTVSSVYLNGNAAPLGNQAFWSLTRSGCPGGGGLIGACCGIVKKTN